MASNPYRPGVGKAPPYLADRMGQLKSFRNYLGDFPENPRNIRVTGLRGVGKTVLLKEYRKLARERDWIVIRRDCTKRFQDENAFALALAQDMQKVLEELSLGEKLKRLAGDARAAIKEVTVGIPGGPGVSASIGGSGHERILEDRLRDALIKVGQVAARSDTGVVFLLDEAHVLMDREKENQFPLSALLAAFVGAQDFDDEDLTVMLGVCGLPPLIANLQAARSHSERLFKVEKLKNLSLEPDGRDPSPAAEALTKPAKDTGIGYAPKTAQQIAEDVSGYPYFIQWYGEALWDAADDAGVDVIDNRLYGVSKDAIQAGLDAEFFEGRYDETRRNEQATLRVAASLGGETFRTKTLMAEYPDKKERAVQMSLNRLIGDNLIYRMRQGEYCYTAPLFGDFLRRRQPRQEEDTAE